MADPTQISSSPSEGTGSSRWRINKLLNHIFATDDDKITTLVVLCNQRGVKKSDDEMEMVLRLLMDLVEENEFDVNTKFGRHKVSSLSRSLSLSLSPSLLDVLISNVLSHTFPIQVDSIACSCLS